MGNRFKLFQIVSLALILCGCGSLFQNKNDVLVRHGTGGLLEEKIPFRNAASHQWRYAWASVAAYELELESTPDGKPLKATDDGCAPLPDNYLAQDNWVPWTEIPTLTASSADLRELGDAMRRSHLRAKVWSKEHADDGNPQIIVAFGGTHNMEDWKSNAHWFAQLLDSHHEPELLDQYRLVRGMFLQAFQKVLEERVSAGQTWLRGAEIIPTGHSLGGGLAQGFAYAAKAEGLPVARVVAFDPSPVSTKREVDRWTTVAPSLTIERIYNRGETLAFIRGIINRWPASPGNATFVDYRYMVDWNLSTLTVEGSIHAHRIRTLACKMTSELGIPYR